MMSKQELEEESFAVAEVHGGEEYDRRKVYYTSTFDDPVLLDFFLNLPQDADGLESPLQEHVAEMQAAAPDQYHVRQRQGHNIAYYMKNGNHNNMQMRIALPRNVIPPTFTSYQSIIGQSGSRSQTPSSAVDYCEYNLGGICQQEKLLGPGYGLRTRVRTITY
eukprot:scaffold2172_cov167-Skeletonema_dohrnii-CCMP3373.AAC.2